MASLLLGAPPMAAAAAAASQFQTVTIAPSLSFSNSLTLILSPIRLSYSISTSSAPTLPLVYCGRGDKKTEKGKCFRHSFGNSRPKNKKKGRGPPRVYAPPLPPRKDEYENDEVVTFTEEEQLPFK